jgi:hypothetical protein
MHNYDKVIAQAEDSDHKLPDMNTLYSTTKNNFLAKTANLNIEQQHVQEANATLAKSFENL